jgi:tRNA(Arg) A34 adenosine deaminase TadA
MFDFYDDKFGKRCINLTYDGGADVVFGALFVKNNRVYGKGRNRLAVDSDRLFGIPHIDYCVHAEQAATIEAMKKGIHPQGGEIYVIGRSRKNNDLTIRNGEPCFVCKRCSKMLKQWNIPVNIPHHTGWYKMTPEHAILSAEKYHNNGFWAKFAEGKKIY